MSSHLLLIRDLERQKQTEQRWPKSSKRKSFLLWILPCFSFLSKTLPSNQPKLQSAPIRMPQICFNLSKSISGIRYNHPRRILKQRSAVKPGLNTHFHLTQSRQTSNSSLSAPLEATKVQSLFAGATLRKNYITNSLLLSQRRRDRSSDWWLGRSSNPLQAVCFWGSRIKTQPTRSHFLLQLQAAGGRGRGARQRQPGLYMKPLHELNMRTIPGTSKQIHKRDAAEATVKRKNIKKRACHHTDAWCSPAVGQPEEHK